MTLRSILLASTLTLGTATTVAASSDLEEMVRKTLDNNGFSHVALSDLSEGDINNIYLTATGEGSSELETVFDGIGLERSTAGVDVVIETPEDPNYQVVVKEELMERGYSADQINMLSDAEMTELYTAITGESASEVDAAIEGAMES